MCSRLRCVMQNNHEAYLHAHRKFSSRVCPLPPRPPVRCVLRKPLPPAQDMWISALIPVIDSSTPLIKAALQQALGAIQSSGSVIICLSCVANSAAERQSGLVLGMRAALTVEKGAGLLLLLRLKSRPGEARTGETMKGSRRLFIAECNV